MEELEVGTWKPPLIPKQLQLTNQAILQTTAVPSKRKQV